MAFFKNPELQRNSWSDFSTQRLVVMPVVLFLIFILTYNLGGSRYDYQYDRVVDHGWQQVFYTAMFLFVGLVIFWGAKNASEGIVDEYNARTWDWQRGHRLDAMEMTIGKLFGPTLYNWYAGSFCLFAMVMAVGMDDNSHQGENTPELLTTILNLALTAIIVHSLSIITALFSIRRADGRGRVKNVFYILFAIYFGLRMLPFMSLMNSNMFMHLFRKAETKWYIFSIGEWLFVFLTFVWVLWAIHGLYRNFRTEYQYKNGAKSWLLFLGYIVFFYAGFNMDPDQGMLHRIYSLLFISLFSFAGIIYITLLLESKDEVMLRKVQQLFKSRNIKELGKHSPLWLITLVVFTLGCILYAILMLFSNGDSGNSHMIGNFYSHNFDGTSVIGVIFGTLFFVIRDVLIFVLMNNFGRKRRADAAALLYIVLLYTLMPWLCSLLISHDAIFLFIPAGDGAGMSWLPALVQAGILFMLVRSKFVEDEMIVR